VVIVLVYGIIAIHDIPARIARSRHHPHEDAIHAAGWISLFMLHLLWPFLWIWAMMYRPDRGWGFAHKFGEPSTPEEAVSELEGLKRRLADVEVRLQNGARAAQPGQRSGRSVLDPTELVGQATLAEKASAPLPGASSGDSR
jgi:hypothetical protein